MSRRRDSIRLVAVAAAYGAAFLLLRRAVAFDLDSPWFVSMAMICFLGLAFVARPLVAIRMPRLLRPIRTWEVESGLYRRLGVRPFGGMLRRPPLRLLNREVYLGVGTGDPVALRARLEAAEASHFWDALLVLPYMAHAAMRGTWGALVWISVLQVLINAYPIMHLRLTRHRLDRFALKTSARPGRRR